MTGVTKVMVCVILSVGWCIQKIPCCYSEKVAHVVAAACFLSCYLNGPLQYVWRHFQNSIVIAIKIFPEKLYQNTQLSSKPYISLFYC